MIRSNDIKTLLPAVVLAATALAPIHASPFQEDVGHAPGRLLVKFKPGVKASVRDQIVAQTGGQRVREIGAIGVQVVEVPQGVDERLEVSGLRSRPEVEFAELDRVAPMADVPDDPHFQSFPERLEQIGVPGAWALAQGDPGVVIAVCDTGVNAEHADLEGTTVPGWCYQGSDTGDTHGHGSGVAGIAAAATDNGEGVASASWGCRIMPIRVSKTGYAYWSDIAEGLTWAAENGARVANISYGIAGSSTISAAAGYFRAKADGVVVGSAGNEGDFLKMENDPNVILVSAIDDDDIIKYWSNYGLPIDLCAPASAVTTHSTDNYVGMSGTSVSAPYVAAVAALVVAANPELGAAQIDEILMQSAVDLGQSGWDKEYGWGRLDAHGAVQLAIDAKGGGGSEGGGTDGEGQGGNADDDTEAPSVEILSPVDYENVGKVVHVKVEATDDVGVVLVELYVDNVLTAQRSSGDFSMRWNANKASKGEHELVVRAFDAAGNGGWSEKVVVVKN